MELKNAGRCRTKPNMKIRAHTKWYSKKFRAMAYETEYTIWYEPYFVINITRWFGMNGRGLFDERFYYGEIYFSYVYIYIYTCVYICIYTSVYIYI